MGDHESTIRPGETMMLVEKLRTANSPSVRDLCFAAADKLVELGIEIYALRGEHARIARDHQDTLVNLTHVQTRCTEQQEEIRALKRRLYGTSR